MVSIVDIQNAFRIAAGDLRAAMHQGNWDGRLSSSALATATAISALNTYQHGGLSDDSRKKSIEDCARRGLRWLASQQNSDGGFGDTDKSVSNISTTMLVRSAWEIAGCSGEIREQVHRADQYIAQQGGIDAIEARYGRDRTFASPILANAAIAGLVPWTRVPALPFEAACLPQSWYRLARLPVVSYAIPALVAIGQAKFFSDPPVNVLTRWIRHRAAGRSLYVLQRMQPKSGGYLEAIPLTSFVVMALVHIGQGSHSVAESGLEFLLHSQRSDGSWPIDSNLATWVTTLSALALSATPSDSTEPPAIDWDWILSCQHRQRHPFTGAAPGGWGWSDLSGAVPDADDTPGALLALHAWQNEWKSREGADGVMQQIRGGLRWLLNLQNRDGGWPTFCRGWGKLPFDRSGSDLTAHAMRALFAWRSLGGHRTARAIRRGVAYLERQQRSDGSWLPLWFGNQDEPDDVNPVYGTSKVLMAYRDLGQIGAISAKRGARWLVNQQNADGGWGGGESVCWNSPLLGNSTVEETALATEALAAFGDDAAAREAYRRGVQWLVNAVGGGFHKVANPIGFYFAKLWYYEELYPLIFTVSALGRAIQPPPSP